MFLSDVKSKIQNYLSGMRDPMEHVSEYLAMYPKPQFIKISPREDSRFFTYQNVMDSVRLALT